MPAEQLQSGSCTFGLLVNVLSPRALQAAYGRLHARRNLRGVDDKFGRGNTGNVERKKVPGRGNTCRNFCTTERSTALHCVGGEAEHENARAWEPIWRLY